MEIDKSNTASYRIATAWDRVTVRHFKGKIRLVIIAFFQLLQTCDFSHVTQLSFELLLELQ